ncbi:conjugal transfer protein [Streptomyces sp. NPDC004050]
MAPVSRRPRPARLADAPPLRRSRPETVPIRHAVSRGPRLARIGVWTALAAGPLALVTVLIVPQDPTAAQAAPAGRPSIAPRPADPAGTAAVFVDLWLRADAATPDSPAATAVRAMAPAAGLPKRARGDAAVPGGVRVVPVRSSSTSAGWTVVVAALTDTARGAAASTADAAGPESAAASVPAVRYFAVSGSGGQDGGPLTVSGSPAAVAAPATAVVREPSAYTRPVPTGGALAATVGEFLRTYLAGGQGPGLERYLSPGVRLSALAAGVYVRVDVEDVAADTDYATATAVPAGGTKARVRVRVISEDKVGSRWPLEYRLEMATRAGRWEVSALDAAASVQGGVR